MAKRKGRPAPRKKAKTSILTSMLSFFGLGKKKSAANSQRIQPVQRPASKSAATPTKPALTPGQQEYINIRRVSFDQLMQYGHKEVSIVCNTQDLIDWSLGLYPGQEIHVSQTSLYAPDRLTDIVRYNPYSQFFCVSVSQDRVPVVKVAVNEISVYNAAEETDTSFPAIPPDVPPDPDRYGNPTRGIQCMEYKIRFRPEDRGRKLLTPTQGVFYPRGTQLSLRRYPQGVAVQDGPAFIGWLDFNEDQLVTKYGIRSCKCFVASCTGTDIYVYVVK